MLDQNTDRMWYLIGVVIVSIVLIVFVNDQFPGIFAGAMNGTKDEAVVEYVEPEPGTKEVSIPYDIEYTTNPAEIRDGEKGLKLVYDDDTADEILKDPVNRVALYSYEEVKIAFGTETKNNPDKPQGHSTVLQQGVDGKKYIFIDPYDNTPLSEYSAMRVNPVTEIVEKGTAPVVSVPFNTQYTLDANQVRSGQRGEKYTDSKGVDHTIKEPVDEVVLYSTRSENIPFQTVRRENREMHEGEERVAQNGVVGKKTVHYHPETGEVMKEVVTTQPVEKIVEYGTLQTFTVPYKTEYTMDDSKIRSGVNGEKYVYSDGSEKVVKQPVNEIKKYPYHTRSIPYDTTYTENKNLYKYKDEEVVVTAGEYGQKREYFDPTTNKVIQTVTVKQPKTKEVHTGWIPLNRSTHLVKSGDTLWGLSAQYNTTVDKLKSWNLLSSDHIQIGWRLIIDM